MISNLYVHSEDPGSAYSWAWKFPSPSRPFLDYPETFQIPDFPGYPETLRTIPKISRPSGNFPDYPETFQTIRKLPCAISWVTRKNFPDGNATMPRWFLCLWQTYCSVCSALGAINTKLINHYSIFSGNLQRLAAINIKSFNNYSNFQASCSVCSAPAAIHLHYGAISCYSCRLHSFKIFQLFIWSFTLSSSAITAGYTFSNSFNYSSDYLLFHLLLFLRVTLFQTLSTFHMIIYSFISCYYSRLHFSNFSKFSSGYFLQGLFPKRGSQTSQVGLLFNISMIFILSQNVSNVP